MQSSWTIRSFYSPSSSKHDDTRHKQFLNSNSAQRHIRSSALPRTPAKAPRESSFFASWRKSTASTISAAAESDSPQESQDGQEDPKALGGPLGYTPFEYVTFGDNQLTHELSIEVNLNRHNGAM